MRACCRYHANGRYYFRPKPFFLAKVAANIWPDKKASRLEPFLSTKSQLYAHNTCLIGNGFVNINIEAIV